MERVKFTFDNKKIDNELYTMVTSSVWFKFNGGRVLVHRNCFKNLHGDDKRFTATHLSVTYYTDDFKEICEKVFTFNF